MRVFTVSFGTENWPVRKGAKRLIPRLVRSQDVAVFRWLWLRIDVTNTKTGQDERQKEIFRSSQLSPEVGDMFRFRGGNRHLVHVTEVTKDGRIRLANGVWCVDAKMLHDFYEVEK